MSARPTRPRSIPVRMLAAAAGVTVAGACTPSATPPDTTPEATPDAGVRREVVLDRGTADVVDLRPVSVQAAPGDVVVLRSANPGHGEDDESPVHHLLTSAPADDVRLFTPAGKGVLPNPGVWGLCRGGAASAATAGCPVPPIEGPDGYDGTSYFSLGALLPGEHRELPLADDLPFGTYRFTCAIHPELQVTIEVVPDPRPAQQLEPLDAAPAVREAREPARRAAADAVVVLGPHALHRRAEVLASVPAVVRVPVGGTVVWRVDGRSPHTVELGPAGPPHLADTGPQDTVPRVPRAGRWDGTGEVRSGVLSADPSVGRTEFALTFTRPGEFRSYDRFHSGISTLVRVG